MNCPGCGAEVAAQAVYCQKCGQRVDSRAAESEEASAEDPRQKIAKSVGGRRGANVPEEELWTGSYSPRAMLGTWVTVGLISIGLLVLAVVVNRRDIWLASVGGIALLFLAVGAVVFYRRLSIHYRLTNQRFFQLRGVLVRHTDLIELININDIGFEQGLIERMVTGTGTISVYSNDRSDAKLTMAGIADVSKVVDMLDNARRAERRRRGLQVIDGGL